MAADPPWDPAHGWRVLDADGNIIAAGPPVELEMVASFGEAEMTPDEENT
jgi:hypothetical protein